jgi:hypothetical protein
MAYRNSKVLTQQKIGLFPIYTEQAGGRFDGFNWTIPFVRVAVYSDFSIVSYWHNQIVLKKGEVESIEEKRRFLSNGLAIRHSRADIPKKIMIWPRDIAKLKRALEMSLLSFKSDTEPQFAPDR